MSFFYRFRYLFFLCIIYILIRSFYWGVPLVWDAVATYAILRDAYSTSFDIINFGMGGHLSQAMFFIMSIFQFIAPHDYYVFNVGLTVFSLLSIVAFYFLVKELSRDKCRPLELSLMTAIFAFHPLVISSMIHFNLDAGALTFFLLYWLALLRRHVFWAVACAIGMIFSKESFIPVLPLPFIFCWLIQPSTDRWIWFKRNFLVFLIPLSTVGLFLAYKVWYRGMSAFWIRFSSEGHNLWGWDSAFMNQLAVIFLLNFNWVISLLLLALVVWAIIRSGKTRDFEGIWEASLVLIMMVLSVYLLTRVRPFTNARYLILATTLILLGVFQWLRLAVVFKRWRLVLLAGLLGCIGIADIRSVDPLSNAYFGTLKFGDHQIVQITRPTGECCSYGRDQLVYNLEFLAFPRLVVRALEDMRLSRNDWVVVPEDMRPNVFTAMDEKSHTPTFKPQGGVQPHYLSVESLFGMSDFPDELYYFVFPNVPNEASVSLLKLVYSGSASKVYDVDGYKITVIHFTSKAFSLGSTQRSGR